VRFVGEKVAAVAAESEDIAEEALSLIDVEYEELPAVFDAQEAMQPDAPLLHDPEDVRARKARKQVVPEYRNGVSALSIGVSEDEVLRALAGADYVIEHTFHTPRQHQVYLEPHACLVELDEAGVAHIWASNKAPFLLMNYLEQGIGLTRDKVKIHMLPLGGDFGGKGSFMDIPLTYYLASATQRPVKLVMSYTEEMIAANPRHACTVEVRSGVMKDGRVVARWLRAYFPSGGYAAFKPIEDAQLPGTFRGARGAYHVPTLRAESHMVYTNTVPGGHMRSPGEAQTTYAIECHTDLLAREIGMDPVEFRILNATTSPRPNDDGEPGTAPRAAEVLRAAAEAIGWGSPKAPDIGRGIALVEFMTTTGIYSAAITLQRDGGIIFRTPIVEQGAGMLTVFRQIVAEEFGVPFEQVKLVQTTDGFDVDRGVGGSRVTRYEGKLAIQLVKRIQARLAELVAAEFGQDAENVRAEPGGFRVANGQFVTISEAATLASEDLSETLAFSATERDRSVVCMAQAVEVHVDQETGQLTPLRMVSVHEVGRIVNSMLHQSQIDGAIIQGLGFALMEGLLLENGRVVNSNLHEYKVPTIADIPQFSSSNLPSDLSLGLTPIGEGPNCGIAPALTNALCDVLGARPLDIPLHPDTILRLSREAAG
jgi:CO/xanthine dehydrogenase Mo-binding subunit